MINYTFLFIGLIYTTIVPGFVVTELLLPKLPLWKKLPLYLVLSVIVSSYLSYFAALVFGFTKVTFLWCLSLFIFPLIYILFKKRIEILAGIKKYWQVILVGILIYIIYFVALLPAIFGFYNNYFVMSGPNWQDTAMHLSIIQSLTQGNFPPQAPYFSGQPLPYYYFSDLHAAVVNTFLGGFFPKILIILNPLFAATFFLSVFALSYQITKKKIFSVISGIAAVFYGNFGFVNLVRELITKKTSYITSIASSSYNFDGNFLQMTPIADYFLQNRPMMVGLSAFVLIVLLLFKKDESDREYLPELFIAGVVTASLVKFQLFGFVISWIFFGVYFSLKIILKKIKILKFLKYLIIYSTPSLLLLLLFSFSKVGERSLFNIFFDSFSWGPWQKHDVLWYFYFLGGNLGIGFVIFVLSFFLRKFKQSVETLSISITTFIVLAIPFTLRFTIYEFDMLKFFYYLIPLICVFLAVFYSSFKHKKISVLIFVFITIISSLSSFNMLFNSYFNKAEGYSPSDYNAGIWILNNTPRKSVFVTMPTVRSAPSDIGGRLRVISYINWPHSHGFNFGEDNVFARVKNVEAVYETGEVNDIKIKYGANYVFYSKDERSKFPLAEKLFEKNKKLELIYNKDETKIYAIL